MGSKTSKCDVQSQSISVHNRPAPVDTCKACECDAEEKKSTIQNDVVTMLAKRNIQMECLAMLPLGMSAHDWLETIIRPLFSGAFQQDIRDGDLVGAFLFSQTQTCQKMPSMLDCSKNYWTKDKLSIDTKSEPSVLWHYMTHLRMNTDTRAPNERELALFDLIVGLGGFTRESMIEMHQDTSPLLMATTVLSDAFDKSSLLEPQDWLLSRGTCPLFHATLFHGFPSRAQQRPVRRDYLRWTDCRSAQMIPRMTSLELNYIDPKKQISFLQWICNIGFRATLTAMRQRADDVNWQTVAIRKPDCICVDDTCSSVIDFMLDCRLTVSKTEATPGATWREIAISTLATVKKMQERQCQVRKARGLEMNNFFPAPISQIIVAFLQV